MASNISNNDGNNEVVSCQAMMTNLHMIERGTSNLPPERQIELIDTMQTRVNDMFKKLKQQVSARAHQTASVAYPSYGSLQPQGSDWEEIYLHDAVSYGSGPGSSSYSAASTFSVRSNSSRRRWPSSRVTTTTSSVSSASSTSAEVSITQFVKAICDAIKSLWHQAEVEGDGNFCKTIFYFIKNIVMSFFNSDTQGHVPLRYVM